MSVVSVLIPSLVFLVAYAALTVRVAGWRAFGRRETWLPVALAGAVVGVSVAFGPWPVLVALALLAAANTLRARRLRRR